MNLTKFFLPPDVFLRHMLVVPHVKETARILDVGGSLGELRKFLPNIQIKTADVVPDADVVYDGKHLPFPDNSWGAVVSVDTLEHISEEWRLAFVREVFRVSKQRVVLIAPYRSAEHEQYEAQLVDAFKRKRKKVPEYLFEHRKFGLVSNEFCARLKKDFPSASTRLVGSVSIDRVNFRIHTFEVSFGPLNRLMYYGKFLWNIAENLWFSTMPRMVMSPPVRKTSRVVIIIDKQ